MYFRLDIILVKGLSKHTLNMNFSGMKINPKHAVLHAFFSICPSCPSKICQYDQNHTFFPILHVFALLNDVRVYICLVMKNNPNYVIYLFYFIFFYEDDIQLQIQVTPLGETYIIFSSPWKCIICDQMETVIISIFISLKLLNE